MSVRLAANQGSSPSRNDQRWSDRIKAEKNIDRESAGLSEAKRILSLSQRKTTPALRKPIRVLCKNSCMSGGIVSRVQELN